MLALLQVADLPHDVTAVQSTTLEQSRIKSIHDMLEVTPEEPAYSALWWNLRGTYWHLESNNKFLVNYRWRYRRGMPVSSSIAEPVVNEVVNLRCEKTSDALDQ